MIRWKNDFVRLEAAGVLLATLFALPAFAATPPKPTPPPKPTADPSKAWNAKSDENTQILIDVLARQSPEGAGQMGVNGLDEQILDLKPGFLERGIADTEKAVATLKQRLAAEKDPNVRQDLEILIQ